MIDWQLLPPLWLVVVVATVLRSFTGFGFAMAAVPGFALFLPPTEAVVLSASLSLLLGIQTFPQYRAELQLQSRWPMFVLAIVGTLIGARLLLFIDRDTFMMLIGVVIIVASGVLARFHPRRRPPHKGWIAVSGLISGLLNGAFAIAGPPIIVYAMATMPDPKESRGLMVGFFSYCALIALITFALAGLVSLSSLWITLAVYPAVFAGDWLGVRLFHRFAGALYRRVAIAALLLLGVSILLKAIV